MQITDYSFSHLYAEHETAMVVDLERRRVLLERLAEEAPETRTAVGARRSAAGFVAWFEHLTGHNRVVPGRVR